MRVGRRQTTSLRLAVAATGLLGCVSGFDRNDQIVNSLRILGVSAHIDDPQMMADWADAAVGDTVHLRSLLANPGGLSTVTVTWLACLPITGQTQPCTDDAYLRDPTAVIPLADDPSTGVLKLGTGVDIDFVVPEELRPLQQMLLDRADQAVNAECALYTPIPLLVIAKDNATGAVVAASKNIRLSPWKDIEASSDPAYRYYPRNANPAIGGFNLSPTSSNSCDGQPLATPCVTNADCGGGTCVYGACSGGTGTITAPAFPDGPQVICLNIVREQSYYTCGLQGPQIDHPDDPPNVPEQAGVIWYMTGGSLNGFSAPSNGSGGSVSSRTFTHFTRPAGPFTIYGVARDGRAGEWWIAQDFQ
ncbi:MAG: hypothetical protein ABUS79_04170 [Pseudomonadota bacterium]